MLIKDMILHTTVKILTSWLSIVNNAHQLDIQTDIQTTIDIICDNFIILSFPIPKPVNSPHYNKHPLLFSDL